MTPAMILNVPATVASCTDLAATVRDLVGTYRSNATLRLEAAAVLMSYGDELVAKHVSGCVTMDALLGKWSDHRYRPTLRADLHPEYGVLADIYDLVAAERGLDVKAFRG